MTTKKTATLFILSFLFFLFMASSSGRAQVINPLIGDISYVAKFGTSPGVNTDEDLRITTHLAYVEHFLRQKDVSPLSAIQLEKRNQLLDLLHKYWSAGIFPRNYDHKDQRRPCFIDKDGRICAVGYLIEQTAGRPAAEEINSKFKYAEIFEMDDPAVDAWIAASGLTKEECAMIQPTYGDYHQVVTVPSWTPVYFVAGPSQKEIDQEEKIDSLMVAADSLNSVLDSTYAELVNKDQNIDSLGKVNDKNISEISKITADFEAHRKKMSWIVVAVSLVAAGAGSMLLRKSIRAKTST